MDAKNNRLSFKPRARLIRTIGDRLIAGPESAIIELVKNAHDADASFAKIIVEPPLSVGAGSIQIIDDGHGMTLTDIETRWMEPATSDKVERKTSPNGRILLGSKGIGRFATARLGKKLRLETTAIEAETGEFQTTVIPEIEWKVFDDTKYLSDISFEYEQPQPKSETGTTMVISGFVDAWTEDQLVELHSQLRRLISPLEEADRTDFRIFLDLSQCTKDNCQFDGSEIVNGPLAETQEFIDKSELHRVRPYPLLSACDYEVAGSFDNAGIFSGTIMVHRGELEPQEIRVEVPLGDSETPCGTVLVHLYIFDRETGAIQNAMYRAGMGQLAAPKARKILDDIAGVAIYRDKFRIRPYGDFDDDWLTLDMRRVQNPSMRIGRNQISGIVIVDTEENSGLIEKSSREGLEENGSFRRLKALIDNLLTESVEPSRRAFRVHAGIGKQQTDLFARAYESAQLNWVEDLARGLPLNTQATAQQTIRDESNRLNRYLKDLEDKQAILEAKVTLGLILGEVLHEGRAPVAFLYDESRRVFRWWPNIFDDSEDAENFRDEVLAILRGMTVSAEKLRDLFRALRPLAGGKRAKPLYYNPNQVILDTLLLFKSRIDEGELNTDHTSEDGVRDILGHREDLNTAVTNIVDNAIFWLDHHRVTNPQIAFNLSNVDEGCQIEISDNGNGIPAEFRELVYDVGFSLKPNGTGLGLSIAQEAIVRSNGNIELVPSEVGAAFRIWVPYGD